LPELFDAAATFVRPEDMPGGMRVSADPGQHVAWLQSDREVGFDRTYVHHVGIEQARFIDEYSRHVLAAL
jgi:hypothetical protein